MVGEKRDSSGFSVLSGKKKKKKKRRDEEELGWPLTNFAEQGRGIVWGMKEMDRENGPSVSSILILWVIGIIYPSTMTFYQTCPSTIFYIKHA
ncbi:unnamed protein product, partial [Linum tenue]